ncbi:MAG: Flp pilus assembly complex ATPase component TadA [Planctomycetes bacterium]|nr:Flp pilus assembly complex ATPase component TadA [Planctomycetota bacterium]
MPPPQAAKGPAPVARGGTTPSKPGATGKSTPAPGTGKPASESKPTGDGKPAAQKPAGEAKAAGDGKAAQKPADKPAKSRSADTPKRVSKSVGAKGGGRRIGQVLVDLGFVDDDQLWDVLEEAKNTSQFAGQVAVARGLITDEQLLQALAEQAGLKVINLEEIKPQAEALALVPETMASVYKILPITLKDKVLTIAIGDPNNLTAVDDLRNLLSISEVVALLAPAKAINEYMVRFYAGKEESIIDLINELENNPELGSRRAETSIDLEDVMEMAEAAPVRKLINMVFLLGIRDKSSDIHFEPFEDEYKIRMRCDGILYEMVPPPRHLASAISSRIKVMANLDIAERRLPQDGRIELNVGGHPIDMRVSVLPTMFGESVVIRVLDRTVVSLDLNKVGLDSKMLAAFRLVITKPNGIILVTGPTGAGKTTTLYSALNELNVITDKLITTEDPVEYEIDGICQCPINTDIDLTFASALRSILRQDPDKILVGEIRDLETAEIAVQASLTGHIVFSTLHTNDAPSSITRLRDMGLEPYLITATLEAILAQRLVRRICEDCRTEYEPSAEQLMELNLRLDDVKGRKLYYGRGCDRCNNTGFRGRMGIFELLVMNDDLRDLISAGVSTDQLRVASRKTGMTTLRESGMRAIYAGLTTLEEVVRETVLEDEG